MSARDLKRYFGWDSYDEMARAEVEKALRSTTARAEAAESRLAQAEAARVELESLASGLASVVDDAGYQDEPEYLAWLARKTEPSPLLAKLEAAQKMAKALERARKALHNEWHNKPRIGFESEYADAGEALRLWKEAGGEG